MTIHEKREQQLGADWYTLLRHEFDKEYMRDISSFLIEENKHYTICPNLDDIFKAFNQTRFRSIKAVIVGQDPYPALENGIPIANGLAFATQGSYKPDSLRNLGLEISRDLELLPIFEPNFRRDLSYLPPRGLLLLNTYLTSRANQSLSHSPEMSVYETRPIRWDIFTSTVIKTISSLLDHIVFIFMGTEARMLKYSVVNAENHLIIETTHPTSKSFKYGTKALYGSSFASRTNEYLKSHNIKEIKWTI